MRLDKSAVPVCLCTTALLVGLLSIPALLGAVLPFEMPVTSGIANLQICSVFLAFFCAGYALRATEVDM